MRKAKRESVFLDVDPSIIEKNMTILKEPTLEEDFNNIFPPSNPVSVIQPSPGFCIKTRTLNEHKKVFINICQTEAIPPPDDITEERLIEILDSDTPSSYRVPMSIGESRTENDKSGEKCTVYDVAVNNNFFRKIDNNAIFRTFLLNVVFEGLQNKYEVELDIGNHVILKNKKCQGTLQVHRIQKRVMDKIISEHTKRPLIEDVTELTAKIENERIKKLEFRLVRKPDVGLIKYIIAEFNIDESLNSEDVIIDAGQDRLIVETPKTRQIANVFLPHYINTDTILAVLDKNTNILYVTMIVEQYLKTDIFD